MKSHDELHFREVQQNRQWWLWAVVLLPCTLVAYGAVRQQRTKTNRALFGRWQHDGGNS